MKSFFLKWNEIKAIKVIFLFSIIHSFILVAYNPNGIIKVFIAILLNISGIILITYFIKIFKRKKISLYFSFNFLLLLIWSLFVIFYSFSFDFQTLLSLFGTHNSGWVWLAPLAIVFGFNIYNWLILFKFFIKILIVGILGTIMLFFIPINSSYALMFIFFPLPIFLLIYFHQNQKSKILIISSLLAFFMISFIFGSIRSNVVYLGFIFIFIIIEYYKLKNIQFIKKIILTFILFFSIITIIVQVNNIIKDIQGNEKNTRDTRTFLVIEVFQDMSDEELIIGRGALGTYYSPYFYEWNKNYKGGDSATRSGVEMGFLNMILKGGYIMLVLYLLILIPASYLGIFKSKNILTRVFGYLVFIQLLMWIFTYPQHYSSDQLLLWMMVGTIISSRNIPNHKLLIKKRKGLRFATY